MFFSCGCQPASGALCGFSTAPSRLCIWGVLVWFSIASVELTMHVSIGAMDLPEAAYRVPATIGGGLMIVFIVLRILLRWPRNKWLAPDPRNDSAM